MAKKEKTQDFSQVIEAIKELRKEFDKNIAEIREELGKKANKDMITIDLTHKNTSATTVKEEKPAESGYPIPEDFRRIVDNALSSRFGIKIVPLSDKPAFMFQLLVPKEYSNAPESTWRDAKADIRSKIITYGEGKLGVQTYVELVKSNLGPEINAKINKDKE